MAIQQGDALPDANLIAPGADGPEQVRIHEKAKGRKIVIFGVPGAFTGTCSDTHVPSFMRSRDALSAKGVDEIICVSVNDPFVMGAWGKDTGATQAGLTMLADPAAELTKALGLDFTAPPVGLYDRSQRYAMVVDDGVVSLLHVEDNPGACTVSSGEGVLEAM